MCFGSSPQRANATASFDHPQAVPPPLCSHKICVSATHSTYHPVLFSGLLVASSRTQTVNTKKHSFIQLMVSAMLFIFMGRNPQPP